MDLGLRARMIAASALTIAVAVVAVAVYDAEVDERMLEQSRSAVESVAEAMQISVQQLGGTGRPDSDYLRDFVSKHPGIREITILDPEKTVVVGTHRETPTILIEGETAPSRPREWDLLAPI